MQVIKKYEKRECGKAMSKKRQYFQCVCLCMYVLCQQKFATGTNYNNVKSTIGSCVECLTAYYNSHFYWNLLFEKYS